MDDQIVFFDEKMVVSWKNNITFFKQQEWIMENYVMIKVFEICLDNLECSITIGNWSETFRALNNLSTCGESLLKDLKALAKIEFPEDKIHKKYPQMKEMKQQILMIKSIFDAGINENEFIDGMTYRGCNQTDELWDMEGLDLT